MRNSSLVRSFLILSLLAQLPSPESEKAWLSGINLTPRDRSEEQAHSDNEQRDGENHPSPVRKEPEKTASGAQADNPNSAPIWEKAFSPEQWPQWGQVLAEVFAGIIALAALLVSAFFIQRSAMRARICVETFRIIESPDGQSFSYSIIISNLWKEASRDHRAILYVPVWV